MRECDADGARCSEVQSARDSAGKRYRDSAVDIEFKISRRRTNKSGKRIFDTYVIRRREDRVRACPNCESPREIVCACETEATYTADNIPGKIKGVVISSVMVSLIWTCECGERNMRQRQLNTKGEYSVRCLKCGSQFSVKVKG